jgi:branched-chain amino acid aminotransferase
MAPNIDWDNLRFAFTPTDVMYRADWTPGAGWSEGAFLPYGDIALSPAACILNYGQGAIEGLKARRTRDGRLVLFRPDANARRLNVTAERMCMPVFPEDRFVAMARELVRRNEAWVPPYGKGTLYQRPLLFGMSPTLGVAPAASYAFLNFCVPVGPYFKGGIKPIHLEATREFHRAAPKGTGHVKATCNYAGGMLAAKRSKARGFDECLYLDAAREEAIEEVGAANFFCVVDGRLLTPSSRSILPGITRDSVLHIAAVELGLEVEETRVTLESLERASEAFCTGTAAVVCPIGSVTVEERRIELNGGEPGPLTMRLYERLTALQALEQPDPYGWVVEV